MDAHQVRIVRLRQAGLWSQRKRSLGLLGRLLFTARSLSVIGYQRDRSPRSRDAWKPRLDVLYLWGAIFVVGLFVASWCTGCAVPLGLAASYVIFDILSSSAWVLFAVRSFRREDRARHLAALFCYVLFTTTAFAVIYSACELVVDGNGDPAGPLHSLYFSIVTLATVGYGDLRPVGLGRLVAVVEVMTGWLLLLSLLPVVLTNLIEAKPAGRLVQQRRRR